MCVCVRVLAHMCMLFQYCIPSPTLPPAIPISSSHPSPHSSLYYTVSNPPTVAPGPLTTLDTPLGGGAADATGRLDDDDGRPDVVDKSECVCRAAVIRFAVVGSVNGRVCAEIAIFVHNTRKK